MSRNVVETVMGAVVLAVAGLFLFFAYGSADTRRAGGYEVVARFSGIDGLAPGAEVRISGVPVGAVTAQRLDPETYLAEVRMSIDPEIALPEDTIAVIASESLLGGRYMRLDIGAAETLIEPGGTILYTQSTPGLEQLLGQAIYGMGGGAAAASAEGGMLGGQ